MLINHDDYSSKINKPLLKAKPVLTSDLSKKSWNFHRKIKSNTKKKNKPLNTNGSSFHSSTFDKKSLLDSRMEQSVKSGPSFKNLTSVLKHKKKSDFEDRRNSIFKEELENKDKIMEYLYES